MTIFVNFFEKNVKFFGNFLTVKWQFSGGSGADWNSHIGIYMSYFPQSFGLNSDVYKYIPMPKIGG